MSGGNAAGTNASVDIILHNSASGTPPNIIVTPGSMPDLDDPRAIVVGDFNGDGVPDFAILSGNPTNGQDDFVTVFTNTTVAGGTNPTFTATSFDLGPGVAAFATGFLTGSKTFNDLAIVYNTANTNDLTVLQNTSSASAISGAFVPHVITGSTFPGTAVALAVGTLYSAPTAGFQDIAVVYQANAAAGIPADESMVRVFQNATINFGFPVTPNPLTNGDYDAGATVTGALTTGSNAVTGIASTQGLFQGEAINGPGIPAGTTIQSITSATAIALSVNANTTGVQTLVASETNPTAIDVEPLGNAGGTWNSIVVTNDDFATVQAGAVAQVALGTVSVLNPIARPTPPIAPAVSNFEVNVNVANPADITDLTVTLGVTDTAIADLKIQLVAPGPGGVPGTGPSITLLENQNIEVGTTTVLVSNNVGAAGTSLGIFDFSPGPPTIPGIYVGTVFDDNATRDIVDLNPVGAYGAPPPTASPRGAQSDYIGHWRPESDFINGETLADFVAAVQATGVFNGLWTLRVTDQIPKDFGQVQHFSLQFSSTQASSTVGSVASQFEYAYTASDGVTTDLSTIVLMGALGDVFPTAAPAVPNTGVGPDVVMAVDNTLGPYSPYGADNGGPSGRQFGRIYLAFVGYFNDSNPRGLKNPTTDTDIFLVSSDDGGQTWTAPVLVNQNQAADDGFSQTNYSVGPNGDDQFVGRTTFMPEIAVDQSTGTLVVAWRSAEADAANAPECATYITTSIDGGQTFAPQTYANPSETAVDAITGDTNVIGPAPDNQSSGNAQTDTGFNYGMQMGLAVANGQVFPVWAGNFYGPNPQDAFNAGDNGNFQDSYYDDATGADRQGLSAECLVPADGHRGRSAHRLEHDGSSGNQHPDRLGERPSPIYTPSTHQLQRHPDERVAARDRTRSQLSDGAGRRPERRG